MKQSIKINDSKKSKGIRNVLWGQQGDLILTSMKKRNDKDILV